MKKRRYLISGAIAAAAVILGLVFLPRIGQIQAALAESKARAAVGKAQGQGGGEACPIDFEALRRGNQDIYAWLYIPGTGISEPLLQRDGDSTYYAGHNSIGGADAAGALFTDGEYNARDFSDPATIIYGKSTWEGRLFSGLQASYSSDAGLRENHEIIIYLPGEVICYTVFAAAPFRNYNIPYYFKFDVPARFQNFLDLVRAIRAVDAHWDDEAEVTTGDQLLILSTPRGGKTNTSYLVLAKRS